MATDTSTNTTASTGATSAITTGTVLWGWMSNPVRILKLLTGISFLFLAIMLVVNDKAGAKISQIPAQLAPAAVAVA